MSNAAERYIRTSAASRPLSSAWRVPLCILMSAVHLNVASCRQTAMVRADCFLADVVQGGCQQMFRLFWRQMVTWALVGKSSVCQNQEMVSSGAV